MKPKFNLKKAGMLQLSTKTLSLICVFFSLSLTHVAAVNVSASKAKHKLTDPVPTTKLNTNSCGIVLTNLTDPVYSDYVPNATNYRYQIENTTLGFLVVSTRNAADNMFRISWVNGIQTSTVYTIKVAAFVNGLWGNYGTACTVTTPVPATKLATASCDVNLLAFTDALYSEPVPNATNYRYLIENTASGFSKVSPRNAADNLFRMSWVSGITESTVYTVKVAAYVNGIWGKYGTACTVATPVPNTKLAAAYCNSTLTSLTDQMFCDPVNNATNYRYLIENSASGFSTVFTRNAFDNEFNLNWISGIQYATVYTVKVAAYVNGIWGNYGTACTVTTPNPVPKTKLAAASCNISIPLLATGLYSEAVANATNYRYLVENVSLGFSKVSTRNASDNLFRLSWVSGISLNTTYTVKVAAYVNGVWGEYGTACTVTTPAGIIVQGQGYRENVSHIPIDFEVLLEAYPNPNQGSFTLNASEAGTFKLINELGQCIQDIEISADNNFETRVENVRPGVYFITGIVGGEVLTRKIIVE